VAVFFAMLAALLLLPVPGALADPFYPALMLGGIVLLTTGLIDDLRGLSALLRLLIQSGVCLLVINYAGVRLEDFGRLIGPGMLELGWMANPITVFAALGVINAFNMVDGMDGLSGLIYIVAAGAMALFAAHNGQETMVWLLLTSLAAVLGFMLLNARFPWNASARVFLGDSGSLLLGFLLAWCFIRLGSGAQRAFMPMTAVWLFAVPLLDTASLIWLRWREGRSAVSADQRHLHHAFLRAGFSVGQTWLLIGLMVVAMAVIGSAFQLSGLPDYLSFYTFMALAFAYYFYIKHSWSSQRFLGRHFIHHDFDVSDNVA
jgi:UDP-GlcNAc:undecaprenyl-phosphate GlcNAc-1-phosphate transferase